MRSILEKVELFPTILYGYMMPLKRIFFSLRMILTYVFFYGLAGVSLTESIGQDHFMYDWLMWLVSASLMGWCLFHITRSVFFDETLRTMTLEQVTEVWRLEATAKTIAFFVFFSFFLALTQVEIIDFFKGGQIKEHFWATLGLLYLAAMLALAKYIAIAPAVRARSYTFFYMIFHPGYLFKIMIFALFTYVPFYTFLYGTKVLKQLRIGEIDYAQLFEQTHVLDFMLHGSVDILAFLFFSSMLVHSTQHFIVPESAYLMRKLNPSEQDMMKPYLDENGQEIDGEEDSSQEENEDDNQGPKQEILTPDK